MTTLMPWPSSSVESKANGTIDAGGKVVFQFTVPAGTPPGPGVFVVAPYTSTGQKFRVYLSEKSDGEAVGPNYQMGGSAPRLNFTIAEPPPGVPVGIYPLLYTNSTYYAHVTTDDGSSAKVTAQLMAYAPY